MIMIIYIQVYTFMHVESYADANMNRSGTPRRPSKKLIFAMSSSAGTCKRSISGSRTN